MEMVSNCATPLRTNVVVPPSNFNVRIGSVAQYLMGALGGSEVIRTSSRLGIQIYNDDNINNNNNSNAEN